MRRAASAMAALATLGIAAHARAGDCVRPTDPGGFNGYVYPENAARSFDGAAVRVWYTQNGKHAVHAEVRTDGVPVDVARVADVADKALAGFSSMGFRAPPSDDDAPECGSDGGDGRLDLYLVDFNAADGQTVADRCVRSVCSSFMLVKANFSGLYATRDEGIRTVVPHELFHAVQNAYDAGMDRFWAEGTAQWATDALDPSLGDLERFLPSYFRAADRSLDAPAGSAVGSFLYGSAIWPVFLTARHGGDVIVDVFERMADAAENAVSTTALAATERALTSRKSSLADDFATFAAWNAATGTRASRGGYPHARAYPEVPVRAWPATDGFRGTIAGLGALYAKWPAPLRRRLVIDADATRIVATALPLDKGVPMLDKAVRLPATLDGEAIVVVSGITTQRSDASFVIRDEAPPVMTPPEDSTTVVEESTPEGSGGAPRVRRVAASEGAGCSASARDATSQTSGVVGLWLAIAILLRVRRAT